MMKTMSSLVCRSVESVCSKGYAEAIQVQCEEAKVFRKPQTIVVSACGKQLGWLDISQYLSATDDRTRFVRDHGGGIAMVRVR